MLINNYTPVQRFHTSPTCHEVENGADCETGWWWCKQKRTQIHHRQHSQAEGQQKHKHVEGIRKTSVHFDVVRVERYDHGCYGEDVDGAIERKHRL